MNYVIPFSFLVIVLVDAFTDTNRDVEHRRGALLYILACVILSLFYLKFTDYEWYWLGGFALLTRLAGFDPFWNLFNGKKFTYEGDPNKPKSKKSFVDRIEAWTGLSIFWLRIFYIFIYKVFLIIYFLYA